MPAVDIRNRLQPSLLDRLADERPLEHGEVDDHRVMSKAQLRQAVLRDLAALFNAIQPLGAQADGWPDAAASVLNFGLPPLSGRIASTLDTSVLEGVIRQAFGRVEPHISASLRCRGAGARGRPAASTRTT